MIDDATDTQRYKVGRRFFIYAPPLKGVRPSKRKPPVNGGVKTFHWGGAKAGHLGARALDRVALI